VQTQLKHEGEGNQGDWSNGNAMATKQKERKEVEIEMTYAGGIDKQSREDKLGLTSRRVVAVSVWIRSIFSLFAWADLAG